MKTFEWFGTATSIIGAFLVALGFMLPGYSCFVCGALAWLYVGYATRNNPLIVLNGTFFVANLIGLYRAIF